MENFNVAGLASGFDWNALVDQLIAIERIPQQRLRSEKSENTAKVDALKLLDTKLGTLETSATALESTSLFRSKSAALSNSDVNITASASTSASKGNFQISITQLATATKREGTTDVGGDMGTTSTLISALRLASDVTEGTFTINGQEVSVASTDTLQDVFDSIYTATSGVVTATYNAVTDKVTLDSSSGELELGGEDDSSNFLSAMKLDQLEVVDGGSSTSEVSSRSALGVVDVFDTIADGGLGITGSGTFYVNGVAIAFDGDADTMDTIMTKVNDSAAGVTMTYDSAADQFRVINNETGGYTMSVIDSSNGLLAAMGLTGSATIGDDLTFTIDGGSAKTSRSNSITSDDHGINGVTINAGETGTQTITIDTDSTELQSKINTFISAFNDVQDFIEERTKIEVDGDEITAGVLAGNRELSSLDSSLRSLAFSSIDELTSGTLFRLEHLGIDFIEGTSKLEIQDSDSFDEAMSTRLDELEDFFVSATDSFTSRMGDFLENFKQTDGILDTMSDTLTERNKSIDEQIEDMERRVEFQRAALEAGFIAMEAAQSNLQTQGSALSAIDLG